MSTVNTIQLKTKQANLNALESAVKSFFLDRAAKRLAKTTIAWYEQYIAALVDWLKEAGITDPAQVTANHIRAYLVDVQGRDLSATSIHHHASAARAFFNFCAEDELIPVSPMRKVAMPRLPKEILPAFAESDIRALLGACDNPRDNAIILCLLDTGCRLEEFISLTIGNVDIATGTVTIKGGKGGKDRVVFLGKDSRRALRRSLATRRDTKPTSPLWTIEGGTSALTRHGFQKLLWRLGQRAGVENCHAHTFRRSFALWSLKSGMDIYSLQRIMGHSSLEMLKRYLALSDEDLQHAHAQHGAVDSLLSRGRK
jgi:integrase/recombinase XerD